VAACLCACDHATDLVDYRLVVAGGRSQVSDLYIVNGNGRIMQRITETPDRAETWPLWTPDGARIYYESRETADRTLSLRAFDLTRRTDELVYGPVSPGELWCAISPDGTKLAHVTKDSMLGQLVLRDMRTGEVQPMARPGERLLRPEWAQDSRRLLCQAKLSRQSPWDLVIVDTATGDRQSLGGAPDTTEFKGRWSPDGQSIVFSVAGKSGRGTVGLEILALETGSRTKLSPGMDERVVSGAWSPRGVMAALRERPKPMSILLWPDTTTPGVRHTIQLDERLNRGRLVWSPDGRYLALNARGKTRPGRGDWRVIIFDHAGNKVREWPRKMQMFCPAWASHTPADAAS
jgi:Tol biopolymer transport system component